MEPVPVPSVVVASHAGNESLWSAFRHSRDAGARAQLVAHYLDFARRMAGSLYARRPYPELEFDDYLQFAREGLLEAVDRYDSGRGASFETYAAVRINGAILTGIQSYSELQEQVAVRRRAVASRIDLLRGTVPPKDDPEAVFSYLADMAIGLAMGFMLDQSGMYRTGDEVYPDNTYTGVEMRQLCQRLHSLLEQLPERQRQVLTWYYLQQMSFEEITERLAISRGRISQLHKAGLAALHKQLQGGRVDLVF